MTVAWERYAARTMSIPSPNAEPRLRTVLAVATHITEAFGEGSSREQPKIGRSSLNNPVQRKRTQGKVVGKKGILPDEGGGVLGTREN